jgi:hypothetical protein
MDEHPHIIEFISHEFMQSLVSNGVFSLHGSSLVSQVDSSDPNDSNDPNDPNDSNDSNDSSDSSESYIGIIDG